MAASCRAGAKPAVGGPLERLQQHLPAQGAKAVLVAVIDQPPVAGRTLHGRGVAIGLRTFDGVTLDDEVIKSLDSIAARFLASTPYSLGRMSRIDSTLLRRTRTFA